MIFLYPQFLLGLLALSIPIIIHLFNFKKTRKIFFSNNQFLKNVKESSSAKLKLKHLLILAARMLFIAFLVFAFAQPFIPSGKEDLNSESVFIYLDNSFSMSNKINSDQSALDLGVNYINEILNLYPPNTQYILLTNEFNAFSNSTKSQEQIREAITEITYSSKTRSIPEAVARLLKVDNHGNERRDVFLISDFQKSTSGNMEVVKNDSSNNYSIIPIANQETVNVFVDSVFLTKPFLFAGQNNQLEVSLFNTSEDVVDDLIVKLFINDVQVANSSLQIGAKTNNSLRFEIAPGLLKKVNQCRISFEEFPVTFDNDFYFSLNAAERISVVEIKSSLAGTNIEKVYANQNIFNLASYNINNVDYSKIPQADLIILNSLQEVAPSLSNALQTFVKTGGHILLIPSMNMNPTSFESFAGRVRFSSLTDSDRKNLSPPDFANPFYENIFEESNVVLDMPAAKRTLNWSSNVNNLLIFNNGEPFLSEVNEVGKIYILGSPLSSDFTNFHQHAIFVPVMYKIASLSKSINEKLYFSVNDPVITLRLDSVSGKEVYKLHNNQQELIPNQRVVGSNLILEVPKNTLDAGHYDLKQRDELIGNIAFNFDFAESLLDSYNEGELQAIFSDHPNIKLFDTDNVGEFSKEMKQAHFGISLWEYALVLALFFLLCEVLLLRFL